MKRTTGLALLLLGTAFQPVVAGPAPRLGDPIKAMGSTFGRSVAISGEYAFVGEPSLGAGTGPVAGMVHVYRKSVTGWKEVDKFAAPTSVAGDAFGFALAVDGGTLIVSRNPPPPSPGFRQANGVTTLVPATPDTSVGAVYAYRRGADGKWGAAGLVGQGDKGTQFGVSVAISGTTALVGAPMDSMGGSVKVFRRAQDGSWSAAGVLPSQGIVAADRFGASVAMDGDRAAVGAPGRQKRGAVFVFHRGPDGMWTQETEQMAARNAPENGLFGAAVAVKGDRVVGGAPAANFGIVAPIAPPAGATADQVRALQMAQAGRGPNGQYQAGMVVVYDRTKAGVWKTAGTLTPFDFANDRFGTSVGIVGDEVWVGAPGSGGIGRIYRAHQDKDGEWQGMNKLAVDSIDANAQFGASFAVGTDAAVVGMPADGGGGGTVAFLGKTPTGNWTLRGTSFPPPVQPYAAVSGKELKCDGDGKAGEWECRNTGLLSYMPISAVGGKRGVNLSGSWGWTDPLTGKDYAIIGRTDAAAFVDVSDPSHPRYLGDLMRTKGANMSSWREIKTYKNYALIVSDGSGDHHGIQFFDLTHLRGVTVPKHFTEDAHYDLGSIHDIVVNEGSGYAYAVGVNQSAENCGGGLHMVDIHDPLHPKFAGCFQDIGTGRSKGGYTHDAQCVMYHGPDARYKNHEICMSSNETTVSVQDVTDKKNIKVISHADYPTVGYTHQGWFTDDQKYWYLDDELDETGGLGKAADATRTIIFDMTDLEQPVMAKEFLGTTKASDHNQYVRGNRLYQSDYMAGLRILDISDPVNPREVGFLDTHPGPNTAGFAGSWNNYPFFKNGAIGVVSIQEGFFMVKDRTQNVVP